MKTFEMTAGRLHWSNIRDFVNEMKFRGYNIELLESKGWIDRKFLVRGDARAIAIFQQAAETYVKENQ